MIVTFYTGSRVRQCATSYAHQAAHPDRRGKEVAMAIRIGALLLSVVLITLPSRAIGQVLSCGRYETQAACDARLELQTKVMADEMRRTAENRANAIRSKQRMACNLRSQRCRARRQRISWTRSEIFPGTGRRP